MQKKWLREWADDIDEAREERQTFDYLMRFVPFEWYIEGISWAWVERDYRRNFIYWDSLS